MISRARFHGFLVGALSCAALLFGACGGMKTATIPPNYNLAAAPQNGVVIGVMDVTGVFPAVNGVSPGMSQSVKNTATGTKYSLALVERGHKSDFYVALPAGVYLFVGGDANSGALLGSGKTAEWKDVAATFQVWPGKISCVGAVVAQRQALTAGNVFMSALSGSEGFTFSVSDVCDPLYARFAQKYPALAPYVVKAVAVQEPAAQ